MRAAVVLSMGAGVVDAQAPVDAPLTARDSAEVELLFSLLLPELAADTVLAARRTTPQAWAFGVGGASRLATLVESRLQSVLRARAPTQSDSLVQILTVRIAQQDSAGVSLRFLRATMRVCGDRKEVRGEFVLVRLDRTSNQRTVSREPAEFDHSQRCLPRAP